MSFRAKELWREANYKVAVKIKFIDKGICPVKDSLVCLDTFISTWKISYDLEYRRLIKYGLQRMLGV